MASFEFNDTSFDDEDNDDVIKYGGFSPVLTANRLANRLAKRSALVLAAVQSPVGQCIVSLEKTSPPSLWM